MVRISQERCIGCRACAGDCVCGAISLRHGKAVPNKDCIRCGHCVAICPQDAVSIPEYDMREVEALPNPRARRGVVDPYG